MIGAGHNFAVRSIPSLFLYPQNWFVNASAMNTTLVEGKRTELFVDSPSGYFLCEGGECGDCARQVLENNGNKTYGQLYQEYIK